MEDFEIVELYIKRKGKAILETQKKYGKYCYSISYNILAKHEDCEECVNDTYIKTWNSIPPNRPNSLSAYLAKIVRNVSINVYNSMKATKRGGGIKELLLDELAECIPDDNTVESLFQHKEELNFITKALNKFLWAQKEENRNLLIRRYFYADSINNLAEQLAMSESKIKSLLFRSRKKLKKFLEKEGVKL